MKELIVAKLRELASYYRNQSRLARLISSQLVFEAKAEALDDAAKLIENMEIE